MGQLTLFPRQHMPTQTPGPVDEVLLIGVAAELDLTKVPSELVRVSHGLGVRYLPAWELAAAELEPLDWVAPVLPSRPGRRVIAVTIDDEVIEQDGSGTLYGNGNRSVGRGALISYCGVRSQDEQELPLGERAGWLVGRMECGSFVLSVHVSEPLLWVYERPVVLGAFGAFGGWMVAAAHLLPGSARDREEWDAGDRDARFDPDVIVAASGGEVTGS